MNGNAMVSYDSVTLPKRRRNMINIVELRKKIGYTQVDFAKLLGVSIASLRRWEKGENNPSPLAIERIEYVNEKVNNGLLEELIEENQQNKSKADSDICKKRKFVFADKKYEIEYMPYVYNGPEDQLEFYNKLINMQENVKNKQDWEKYSRRLSLVKSAGGELTSQYLLEKPKDSNKSWSADSGAHGWHRYVGRFPAQLVRAIINSFALNENDLILDPFCGSGTTVVEARLLGIPAIGIEISPLSAMISRVKSRFPDCTDEICKHIDLLEKFYKEKYSNFLNGRSIAEFSYEDIIEREGNYIQIFSNMERWFTKEALLGTSIVVEYIVRIKNNKYISELIATALSAKMRSIGNVDVDVVRAEYRKVPRENVDVLKLVVSQLRKFVKSIMLMNTSHKGILGKSDSIKIIEGSCLSTCIEANSISAIITSPPYGVESLSYLRTHLLSFRALEPVLGVDPYNFGGEVIGSEYLREDDVSIEKLKVIHKSEVFKDFFYELLNKEEMGKLRNRIFMMMKFFEDMNDLIINFQKWLKPGGKVAFVIGNKKIGDYIIPTDKIITEIFENSGFKYIDAIAHKLKTNNSNSKVPWQDRIIENEFVIFYEKV